MSFLKYLLAIVVGIGILYFFLRNEPVPETGFTEIKVRNSGNIDFSLAESFELNPSVQVTSQTNHERIIHEFKYYSKQNFYMEAIRPLVHSTNVKVKDGFFYLLDNDKTFKKFDTNFEYISTTGLGRGRGPGEVQLATDFNILNDKTIVTACPVSMKVVSYDLHSDNFEEYIVKNATRAILVDETVYYSAFLSDYFLYKYDIESDHYVGIFNLLENQIQSINALNSFSAYSEDFNKWCFAFIYTGFVMCLDVQTNEPMVAETMSMPGYLPFKYAANGSMTVVSEYLPSSDISIYKDKVVLLSGHINENDTNISTVFDVFDINSLQYVSSFSIPGNYLRFDIEENLLLAHNREEDYLTLFRFADVLGD